MEDLFVTYDQALYLKELGFDVPCINFYIDVDFFLYKNTKWLNFNLNNKRISAPLKQQVFRWFREKYYLASWVQTLFNYESNGDLTFKVRNPDGTYVYTNVYFEEQMGQGFNGYFKSHEEAESACIDALIEIIKNKKN